MSNLPSKRFKWRLIVYGFGAVSIVTVLVGIALPTASDAPRQWQVDFLSIVSCVQPSRDLVERRIKADRKDASITEMKGALLPDQYCSDLIRSAKILHSGAIEIMARIAEKNQRFGKPLNSYARTDAQFVFYPSLTGEGSVQWTQSCNPNYSRIICNHE